jgi:hypothetical protein
MAIASIIAVWQIRDKDIIADLTKGTSHFNLTLGAVATAVSYFRSDRILGMKTKLGNISNYETKF